jgi:hypothetical protein
MARSASIRFYAECPDCKTGMMLAEWSESVGERETINFWCCPVCEKEFETVDRERLPLQTAAEIEEPFLPNLLVA